MGPIPDQGQGPPREHPEERSLLHPTRLQTKKQRHQHANQSRMGHAIETHAEAGGQTGIDGQNRPWQSGSEPRRLSDSSEH